MHVNTDRKLRRVYRVRKNLKGTKERPRVSVFRSNRYIYAQAIDDSTGQVVAAFSSLKIKEEKVSKKDIAKKVGEGLSQILVKKGVTAALFDRGSYAYHGRVQMVAEGLRSGGLQV